MEKSWENFWTTGKVEDYLTYCNGVEERQQDKNGTFTSCDTKDSGTWREDTKARREKDI